jgi:hypothetical protein
VSTDHTITVSAKTPLTAPPYEPDNWNDGPGNPPVPDNKQGKNNCYRYAVNKKTTTGGFARPGRKGNNNPPRPGTKDNPAAGYDCAAWKAAAKADNLTNSTKEAVCDNGYKVALVVGFVQNGTDVSQDYHWYRQDSNGKWSHKPGGQKATNKDSGGNEITDPETCDKGTLNDGTKQYENFCGYFCVTKTTEVELIQPGGAMPAAARRALVDLITEGRGDVAGREGSGGDAAILSNTVIASLLARSGEDDSTIVFTSATDLDSIADLLTGLPPTGDPMWESRLGYAGFVLEIDDVPSLGTRRVRVWNGVVQSDEGVTRSFHADAEGLEDWLMYRFFGRRILDVPDGASPGMRALGRPHPNPFAARTVIPFSLDAPGHVELKIYDVAGRLVRGLAQGEFPAGPHRVVWDGRDAAGKTLRSGTYFYRLIVDGEVVGVRKAVLLRP